MPKIFVSYSRKDQRFARRFVSILKRAYGDTSVFYDRDISGGTEWWSKILKEIGKADIFIYLLSSQSLTAPYCRAEMREAMRLGKRFLPVRIKANTRIDQAQDLARHIRQWLDLSSGLNTEALADLYREINTTLENPPIFQPQPRAEPTAEPEVKDKPNPLFDWLGDPRLQGIGVIVGILALLLAGYQVFWSNDDEDESPTPVTQEVATDQEKAFKLEEAGVSSNDEWTPYSEEINGVEMVLVPAGCFMMGSDPEVDEYARAEEQPEHQVCLTESFWIDQYEVTNQAYQAFIEDGGYETQSYWSEAGWRWKEANNVSAPGCLEDEKFNAPRQPIACVSWYEAEAYAHWRGGSLPTEAQWEYAARGMDGRTYPWGNEFDGARLSFCDQSCEYDWHDKNVDDGFAYTAPVGSYEAGKSWVGAYDMVGNVWEWTADWYAGDYYAQSPIENPIGTETGDLRVMRGGSWGDGVERTRTVFRGSDDPNNRFNPSGGFRVVCVGCVPQ